MRVVYHMEVWFQLAFLKLEYACSGWVVKSAWHLMRADLLFFVYVFRTLNCSHVKQTGKI